jgi:hypothetical protein
LYGIVPEIATTSSSEALAADRGDAEQPPQVLAVGQRWRNDPPDRQAIHPVRRRPVVNPAGKPPPHMGLRPPPVDQSRKASSSRIR